MSPSNSDTLILNPNVTHLSVFKEAVVLNAFLRRSPDLTELLF